MQNTLRATLLCALVLAGCSESASPTEGTDTDRTVAAPVPILAYGRTSDVAPTGDTERLQIEYGRLRADALNIISADQSFAVRDRRIRSFLSDHGGFALIPYLKQFASIQMLRETIDLSDDAALEPIDHYTRLLVDAGSPEAVLISRSLTRLKGRWSSERIRRAAQLTVERAVTWAEKVCTTCAAGKVPAAGPGTDLANLDAKRRLILKAADDLRELAGP